MGKDGAKRPDRRQKDGVGYDERYFALKHRLTKAEAKRLIAEVGDDRAALNAAAAKLNFERQR